jgi:hypothetical protein
VKRFITSMAIGIALAAAAIACEDSGGQGTAATIETDGEQQPEGGKEGLGSGTGVLPSPELWQADWPRCEADSATLGSGSISGKSIEMAFDPVHLCMVAPYVPETILGTIAEVLVKSMTPVLVSCAGKVDGEYREGFDYTLAEVEILDVWAGSGEPGPAKVRIAGASWPKDKALPFPAKKGPDLPVADLSIGETVVVAMHKAGGPDGSIGTSEEYLITADHYVFKQIDGELKYGVHHPTAYHGTVPGGLAQLEAWAVEAASAESFCQWGPAASP